MSELTLALALLCSACSTADFCPIGAACTRSALAPATMLSVSARPIDAKETAQAGARQIQLVIQQDDGSLIRLSANSLRVRSSDWFSLSGAVTINGPQFQIEANQLDIHMQGEDHRMEISGEPARFEQEDGSRMEAGQIQYDSRKHEVTFPAGLILMGKQGQIRVGSATLNLDTRELISGGKRIPQQ